MKGVTVYDGRCMSHPPGVVFQARLLDNQEDVNSRPISGMSSESSRRDAFNADFFLGAPALFHLWRYREWKIGAGACGSVIHSRRIRYEPAAIQGPTKTCNKPKENPPQPLPHITICCIESGSHLCRICQVQIQPTKSVLHHAHYAASSRQHKL